MFVDGYTDTDCSNTENNNIIPIFNIYFFFNFIFIFVLSLSYRKWVVGLNINDPDTKKWTQGLICPHPRAIYMYDHVFYHNIQTSSPLKPLGQLKPNFM